MSVATQFMVAGMMLMAFAVPASARERKVGEVGEVGAVRVASACIVRRDPVFAGAWLNALPASAEEQELIDASRRAFDSCTKKSGMTIDSTTQPEVRRAVAGELLMRDFPRLPAVAPLALGTDPWFVFKIKTASNGKFDHAVLRSENFANCVALSRWGETVALLAAGPEDAGKASEALRPSLSACLVPGMTVTFKIASLRAMLAEAVYHVLAQAAAAGAAAKS